MSDTPFRLALARAEQTLVASCYADPRIFTPEEGWPDALVLDMVQHNGVPCEGQGEPGIWCEDCRFGTVEDA